MTTGEALDSLSNVTNEPAWVHLESIFNKDCYEYGHTVNSDIIIVQESQDITMTELSNNIDIILETDGIVIKEEELIQIVESEGEILNGIC